MVVVFWKAEHNEVRKEVMGCSVAMPISLWPKHQLTLFCSGKLKMVLKAALPSIPHKETMGAKDSILQS